MTPLMRKSLLFLLFIAVVVTFALYGAYYHFSQLIWSMNQPVTYGDVMPMVRANLDQHDGIETYVLYVLMFVDLTLVALVAWLTERLKPTRFKWAFWPVLLVAFFVVLIYFRRAIGFNPPLAERADWMRTYLVVGSVGLGLWLLTRFARWRSRLADTLIVLGLLPVCFVATEPISLIDYNYVFAPALRLIDHFRPSEIYFQYDLLLSLVAAGWMKLGLALKYFPVVAQASYYALFLGGFFLARRLFRDRRLAYGLLFALVLMKAYALMHDSALVFQVTPLRLDLWIILLAIAYERGIYSKWLGVTLGLLAVVHKAFGTIYAFSYVELLVVLCLLDAFRQRPFWPGLRSGLKRQIALAWPNLAFIAGGWAASRLLLGSQALEAAASYQKIGIGFIQIYHQSFYWYVPIMLAMAFVLLLRQRLQLDERYFRAGLFLVLLAIGNSLYFFGRSHEHNIINIAAVLLFALFLLFDLAFADRGDASASKFGRFLAVVVPLVAVLTIAFYYSGRIFEKWCAQAHYLKAGQGVFNLPYETGPDVIKAVTGGNPKVYFLGDYDFSYYYAWGYVPQGRYQPFDTWVFKKDAWNFVQGLIEDGYYVVVPEAEAKNQREFISGLRFGHDVTQDGFRIMWK